MKMSITRVDPHSIEIPKKPPNKSASEHRRATKPIMEKRRRARINNSLEQLKMLILEAHNKDPAKYSKLEKADILEMTVQFLKSMQKKRSIDESTIITNFKDGYDECASEVKRFVDIAPDMDIAMKKRIKTHLSNGLQSINSLTNNIVSSTTPTSSLLSTCPSSPTTPITPLNMKTEPISPLTVNRDALTTISINNKNSLINHLNMSEPELTTPPPSADSLHFNFRFSPIPFNYHQQQSGYVNFPISPRSIIDDDMNCTPVDCSKSSKLNLDPSVWRPW